VETVERRVASPGPEKLESAKGMILEKMWGLSKRWYPK